MKTDYERPEPAIMNAYEAPPGVPVPKIYLGGPGLRTRLWEFDEWKRNYGDFGTNVTSHGWHAWGVNLETDREYCQAVIMDANLGCRCEERYNREEDPPRCQCVGELVHRGACLWCDWEADVSHDDENGAVEDALDHAWPGWRDLPVVDEKPHDDKKKIARWEAKVVAAYPPGWVEQGGPIKTWRRQHATRHVPGRAPGGGYDLGVDDDEKVLDSA